MRGSSVDGMADHRVRNRCREQNCLRDQTASGVGCSRVSVRRDQKHVGQRFVVAASLPRITDNFEALPRASPGRFWPDCCGSCPPVIKHIVFWTLFVGLGCLFLFQKLQERKQHPAKAALATAASHSSPTPSASPVSPAAGQPAKPKPTAILSPSPALKLKPTPMLPKPTPMLPKPTPMLRPNPNGVQ